MVRERLVMGSVAYSREHLLLLLLFDATTSSSEERPKESKKFDTAAIGEGRRGL